MCHGRDRFPGNRLFARLLRLQVDTVVYLLQSFFKELGLPAQLLQINPLPGRARFEVIASKFPAAPHGVSSRAPSQAEITTWIVCCAAIG